MQSTMFQIDENTIFDTATGLQYRYGLTGRPCHLTHKEAKEENALYPEIKIGSAHGPADAAIVYERDAATAFWNRLKEMAVNP